MNDIDNGKGGGGGHGPGQDADQDERRRIEIVLRAVRVMEALLADLPLTEPWSGYPAPAFRPLPPA